MMKIKVFSDMVCPYCYVGKLRLDQAIERLGLNVQEAEKVLNSNQYLEEVDADIREARMYGIQSVPFFIFENRLAVSGAQPVEVFMQALQKTQTICEEGTTCGPDGCCLG